MTKIGDIIKFALKTETLIPDEDLENGTILDDTDYKHTYDISYSVNDYEEYGSYNYTLDEGAIPDFTDDIEECVKEEMESCFKEVTDYEIFDVDDSRYEYKTAKVRIKAIGEEQDN